VFVIPIKNFVSFAKQNFTNSKSGASLSSALFSY